MAKNFSLNQCALLPAEVNPVIEDEFPMLAGVQSIDYYESILSPSISVQVKILDVDGNLSAKGVYGGEKLAIKIVAGKDSELEDFVITPEDHELILNSIKDKYSNLKAGVIFQPHLFSRTKDLLDDFAKVLSKFDEVYLLEIYPAREEPIEGVSSDVLLEKIICDKKSVLKIESVNEKIESIDCEIIAVLGAGNVANSIQSLKKKYYESSI